MLRELLPFLAPIAGFLTFFGVLFVVLGAAMPARRDPIEERFNLVTQRSRTLEEIEMQAPFMERLLKPMAAQLSRALARLTPASAMEGTQRRLLHAGPLGRMQVSDFVGIQGLSLLLGLALGVALGFFSGQGTVGFLFLLLIFGGFGYIMPELWLRGEISRRKTQIAQALPDAIDLLTISVEAGLGFDQALMRVVNKSDNALTREFARVLREMRIDVPRRDALRAMVERTGVDDLNAFIGAILQAEQLGASMTNVLRIQAVEMRVRRRQRAETLAHQAPIKMLFPMVFLIFPPIFVVVLGPAIPDVVHAFLPHFHILGF